jgi:hypothetical protein
MKRKIIIYCLGCLIVLLPQFIFSQSLEKTHVLILGTPHLNHMPEGFDPSHLDEVLATLEKKKFDLIAIESMSGERINEMNGRQLPFWKDVLEPFVAARIETGQKYQILFGMSYSEAVEKRSQILKQNTLDEVDRESLLKSYLCTYDNWSALLQYNQLQNPQHLPDNAREHLEKLGRSWNEINLIAVKLGVRMNLHSLYPIDDLDDEARLFLFKPEFMDEFQTLGSVIEKAMNHPVFVKSNEMEGLAISKKDFFNLYQYLNSEEYTQGDFDAQWKIWFETNLPSKGDIARYYLWEMRNLRITANIAELIALNPGKKILVIIGASHKSFVEKYLGQMPKVELMKF